MRVDIRVHVRRAGGREGGWGEGGSRRRRERHDINNSRGFNMYEASGQWSTTHSQPQPLLSDGSEQRGRRGGGRGAGTAY